MALKMDPKLHDRFSKDPKNRTLNFNNSDFGKTHCWLGAGLAAKCQGSSSLQGGRGPELNNPQHHVEVFFDVSIRNSSCSEYGTITLLSLEAPVVEEKAM